MRPASSGAASSLSIGGRARQVAADLLAEALAGISPAQLHRGRPSAVSITQATDLGAVYSLDEIRAIAEVTRRHGLRLHMDGARFANAVARLGCSPAELTWQSGVDIMSFGATKNGGALCDAIVVFAPELADAVAVQLRRAGQVWSKMRFASAQLIAYVENGLWLEMAAGIECGGRPHRLRAARHSCAPAAVAPIEANEIFLELPGAVMDALEADGFQFYRRTRNPCPLRLPFRRDRCRGGRARRRLAAGTSEGHREAGMPELSAGASS